MNEIRSKNKKIFAMQEWYFKWYPHIYAILSIGFAFYCLITTGKEKFLSEPFTFITFHLVLSIIVYPVLLCIFLLLGYWTKMIWEQIKINLIIGY